MNALIKAENLELSIDYGMDKNHDRKLAFIVQAGSRFKASD